MIHFLGFIQLYFLAFVAVFIWAFRRSRRRFLTTVYSLVAMVVSFFVLSWISGMLSFDHGVLAFAGLDLAFVGGAVTACLHSSYTMKMVADNDDVLSELDS